MSDGNGKSLTLAEAQRRLERNEKNIDELFNKYESVGRTNWTIVLSAAGVILVGGSAIIGAIIGPISATLDRHERGFVTVDSSQEYRKRMDDAMTKLVRDLDAANERLNTRVDELRRDLGGAYSFSDKIKEMEIELSTLRERFWRSLSEMREKTRMQESKESGGRQ